MSNKSVGTKFERDFAQMLSDAGFWVHCLKDNQNGQPFDVIAAKDGQAYVFDCKDCAGGYFNLSRMEENQRNAMKLWAITGNNPGLFALRVSGFVYLVPHRMLEILMQNGQKSINLQEIGKYGQPLDRWLKSKERQMKK